MNISEIKMEKETKETIFAYTIAVLIVVGLFGGFFLFVNYMFAKDKQELHDRIRDNINLSKPFNDVVAISSDFICCAEGWYFVSIQATTDDYPGSPQWIYDFRYDDNTDTLYYDDDIDGIGVKNSGDK